MSCRDSGMPSTSTSVSDHGPPGRPRPAADITDARDRIVIDHQAHDQGIVEVDPVGHLLGAVVRADRYRRQARDVAELRPIGRRHLAVGDAMHAVRADPEIAREKSIPFGVIDVAQRIGVVAAQRSHRSARGPAWPLAPSRSTSRPGIPGSGDGASRLTSQHRYLLSVGRTTLTSPRSRGVDAAIPVPERGLGRPPTARRRPATR